MYYRGRRVPLSEKEFHPRLGRGEEKKGPGFAKEKLFSFNFSGEKEEKKKPEERKTYAFYRPGVTPMEDEPLVSKRPERENGRQRSFGPRWALQLILWGGIALTVMLLKTKAVDWLQGVADFKLAHIRVEGTHYLTESQVLKAAQLTEGQSMFQLDLAGTHDRIRQLDWVERDYVERRLPKAILISVQERKPMALVDSGALYGVDKEGRLLSTSPALLSEDLPLISGVRVPVEAVGTTLLAETLRPALDFFTFLQKKDGVLAQDVSEVNLSEPGCLKVTFMDGIEAKFNPLLSDTDLKRMAYVISDLNQKGKRAGTLDFRYRDMVLVKTR